MDRRAILKYTAYVTGYAITAPLTSAFLSGCKAEPAAPDYMPSFLSEDTYLNLKAVVDTMLPKTDTPGALEVGVPEFIDLVLDKYTEEEDRQKMVDGFQSWLSSIQDSERKPYHSLSAEDQLRLLNVLDKESIATAESLEEQDLDKDELEEKQPWWLDLKSLAINSYFASEKVGTEVLAYDPIPGPYQGCIPLSDVGKAWSL
ncbi:gluconate 2-dehydrogenase subunit 3 family protein [Lewinella cohaerens]|uniref:gluconate 2-dehydrogenase subunit 3 family protein n=1 Tax=Lewinella cohaerens TaxID=70995 RepID=UPI0003827894|nr:gluconate 2-dehydrogenase subunit 3 family protein [Lewinella cohaerens]